MYKYIYIYAHTHTHTHTHIYIYIYIYISLRNKKINKYISLDDSISKYIYRIY